MVLVMGWQKRGKRNEEQHANGRRWNAGRKYRRYGRKDGERFDQQEGRNDNKQPTRGRKPKAHISIETEEADLVEISRICVKFHWYSSYGKPQGKPGRREAN